MWALQNNQFIKLLFYGNYFYGLCAIALSIEASLQQQYPLNPLFYYILIFCITVVYYSRAYISEKHIHSNNERTLWYARSKTLVLASQILLTSVALLLVICFICYHWAHIVNVQPLEVVLILIFTITGLLYYGVSGTRYSLRKIGWLKPFVIGFAWAGLVTYYPIIFYSIQNNIEFKLTTLGCLLFLKNFMFISVLGIMFDIKDYASDSGLKVNTFVVNVGLRKTIFFIIIPLCVLGLGTFILYGVSRNFHLLKITLNVLPFVLLLLTAYSLHTRRSILYYLVVVDGLMLVKAFCGSVAIIYF